MNSNQSEPFFIERLIAALSYLTMGFVGFIWLLIALFTKNNLRSFIKYHIFQSIFIALAYFLLCQFIGLILNILSIIPIINQLVMQITLYLNMPLIFSFSLIQVAVYGVILFLTITSFQGKFSYIPWVSDIIKANVRNS